MALAYSPASAVLLSVLEGSISFIIALIHSPVLSQDYPQHYLHIRHCYHPLCLQHVTGNLLSQAQFLFYHHLPSFVSFLPSTISTLNHTQHKRSLAYYRHDLDFVSVVTFDLDFVSVDFWHRLHVGRLWLRLRVSQSMPFSPWFCLFLGIQLPFLISPNSQATIGGFPLK